VSLVFLIRSFTLIIGVFYGLAYLPYDWLIAHFQPRFSGIGETGHSLLLDAGEYGVYITAALCIPLAFTIPRWRSGPLLLSGCLLLMALSLLTRLEEAFIWEMHLSIFIEISSAARTLCFALPPLMLSGMLLHPTIRKSLTIPSV
jgi:hypothetical protein